MSKQQDNSEVKKELEEIYDCTFCDGNEKVWNLKTEVYEECYCVEKLKQLDLYLQKEVEKATRDIVNEALNIKVSHPEGYHVALAIWADKKLAHLTPSQQNKEES